VASLAPIYRGHALGEGSLGDQGEDHENEQDHENQYDQGDDDEGDVVGRRLLGGEHWGGACLPPVVHVKVPGARREAKVSAPAARAREKAEEPQVAVAERDPESVLMRSR
jgi:hypothetical protein